MRVTAWRWIRSDAGREAACLAALLLLVTVPIAPVVYLGRAPLPDYLRWFAPWFDGTPPRTMWNALWFDAVGQYWPWRSLLAGGLRDNTLPLWNPYQFAGYAFCGNGQSALFYPLNWLCFRLFSVADGFRLTAVLHLWLAAAGGYRVLRELGGSRAAGLVSGTICGLSGFMLGWLMLPTLVSSAAWLPWAVAGIERCRRTGRVLPALLGGAAVGLSALAGHPQVFYYAAVTAALLALVRLWPRWQLVALFLVVGGLTSAPMVLPLLELAPRSHRPPAAGDYTAFLGRAIPADRLITQFLPRFYGSPSIGTVDPAAAAPEIAASTDAGAYWGLDRRGAISPGDFTEFSLFIGLFALPLLGLALVRGGPGRLYGGIAVIALLLAYGAPLNAPLVLWLPGYASGAGPCRLALVWCCTAAVAAGLGLDAARQQPPGRRELAGLAGVLAGLFLLGWLLARVSVDRHGVGPLLGVAQWRNLTACLYLLPWMAAGLVVLCRAPRWLPAMVAVELVAAGWGFNPHCEPALLDPEPPLLATLRAETEALGGRLVVLDPPAAWGFYRPPAGLLLPPNLATAARIRDLGGYDSLLPAAHKAAVAALCDGPPTPLINGNMLLLGNGSTRWPGCLVLRRDQTTGTPLWQLGFGPATRVGPSGGLAGKPVHDGRNRVAVEIGSGAELLRDSPFPGWHAYAVQPAGGVRELAWTASALGREIAEPLTGAGQVRWAYAPVTVRVGLFAALCATGLLAAALLAAPRGSTLDTANI